MSAYCTASILAFANESLYVWFDMNSWQMKLHKLPLFVIILILLVLILIGMTIWVSSQMIQKL